MLLAVLAVLGRRALRSQSAAYSRLLEHAERHPGLTVGQLARALELSAGTLHYHLARAEQEGALRTLRAGRRRLVFPAQSAVQAETALAAGLLRGRSAWLTARAIAASPGISLLELFARVPESPRAVYYNVKKLREAGLIRSSTLTRYRDLAPTPRLLDALRLLDDPSE